MLTFVLFCCVSDTFFKCFECLFLCFTQFGVSFYCYWSWVLAKFVTGGQEAGGRKQRRDCIFSFLFLPISVHGLFTLFSPVKSQIYQLRAECLFQKIGKNLKSTYIISKVFNSMWKSVRIWLKIPCQSSVVRRPAVLKNNIGQMNWLATHFSIQN